jgi:hypothetical protein
MARRAEWLAQAKLSRLLDRWLPDDAFFTATDAVARSATSGAMRKRRGLKPGVPDVLIWCRHTGPIALELKGPSGRLSASQLAVREALLRANCIWWECRSANAAMAALAASGLEFREIVQSDGSVERWRQPRLASWEQPRQGPGEWRALNPREAARKRTAARRWRERQRALKAAAERDDGAQRAAAEA